MAMADRQSDLRALEAELGLPAGFYDGLMKDDDWSFVIKLHALFESATTFVLSRCLRKPELEEVFSHIEMSNSRGGKIAFGKILGLFDEEERRFLRQLSELRNNLVHRVANVSFAFKSYLLGLDTKQRESFATAFGFGLNDPIEIREDLEVPRNKFVLDNPKVSMWMCGYVLLAGLYQEKTIAELQRQADGFMRQILEAERLELKTGSSGAL
jgi:hypothetical protein